MCTTHLVGELHGSRARHATTMCATHLVRGHRGQQGKATTHREMDKANPSCCPLCPRTTPFPEEESILGVIYGVLLWADMNAATPLGAWGRSVVSLMGLREKGVSCQLQSTPAPQCRVLKFKQRRTWSIYSTHTTHRQARQARQARRTPKPWAWVAANLRHGSFDRQFQGSPRPSLPPAPALLLRTSRSRTL